VMRDGRAGSGLKRHDPHGRTVSTRWHAEVVLAKTVVWVALLALGCTGAQREGGACFSPRVLEDKTWCDDGLVCLTSQKDSNQSPGVCWRSCDAGCPAGCSCGVQFRTTEGPDGGLVDAGPGVPHCVEPGDAKTGRCNPIL
jgi:hypothetical protein